MRKIIGLLILVASVAVLGIACGGRDDGYVSNYEKVDSIARANLENVQVAETVTFDLESSGVHLWIRNFDNGKLEPSLSYSVGLSETGIRERVYYWDRTKSEQMFIGVMDGKVKEVTIRYEGLGSAFGGYQDGQYVNLPWSSGEGPENPERHIILTEAELEAAFQEGRRIYNDARSQLHILIYKTNKVVVPLRRVAEENDWVHVAVRGSRDGSWAHYEATLQLKSDFSIYSDDGACESFYQGLEESLIIDSLNANDNQGEYLAIRNRNAITVSTSYSRSGGVDDDHVWFVELDGEVLPVNDWSSLGPYSPEELKELKNQAEQTLQEVRDDLGIITTTDNTD